MVSFIVATSQQPKNNSVSILQILEGINYVGIIILTALAVYFAYKTYMLQKDKSYNLLCRLNFLENGSVGSSFLYGLEIYNDGNKVAQNIEVVCGGTKVALIEYLKPQEVYTIPLGRWVQTISGDKYDVGNAKLVNVEEGKPLYVDLNIGEEHTRYPVSTDAIFSYKFSSDGSLKDIEKSIDKLTKEVKDIKIKIKK